MLLSNFFSEKKKSVVYTLSAILTVLSVLNISSFSINQGFNLVIVFVALLGLFIYLMLRKLKVSGKQRKKILPMVGAVVLGTLLPSTILQIPQARSLIIPPNLDLVTQLTLGTDVSWVVSASVFVDSLWRGLVGMGVDTYSVAFNKFKPLNQSLLSINNINFYYGGNEIFTQFANGGLFWLLAWMFFGFLIYKLIKRDYEEFKSYKNNSLAILLLFIDFTIAFIFIASIFSTYSVLIVLTLLLLISLETILRNILRGNNTDKFVIKLWAVDLNTSSEGKGSYNVNVFLTALVFLLSTASIVVLGSRVLSSYYLLKAEAYYIEQNLIYQGDVYPSITERENFINNMAYYYSQSARYDKKNPLANRKDGLMSLEKVGIASEKYSNSAETENSDSLIRDVALWKNYAIDSTRKSLDVSPSVYDNWEARVRAYMGLIGLGFSDYTTDAVYALSKAIELKPLNYELYYSKAQVYLINGEKDNALASLTEVFGIYPQHVPSLILAAEINKDKGNVDVYESYLKAAKKVLESIGSEDNETYKSISKQLLEISNQEGGVEETNVGDQVSVEDANISVEE
jgi:tetratricopeptide (TPR) repeat protein